jgi:hypothetical protein
MKKIILLLLIVSLAGMNGCSIPLATVRIEKEESKLPESEFIPLSGQQILMSTRMVAKDVFNDKIVCVVKLKSDQYDIFTLDKDGSDLKRLTFDGLYGEYGWFPPGSILWVFNGAKIFYTYSGNFYVMNPDGTDAKEFNCDGTLNIEITPERDKIIFPGKGGAIYLLNSQLVPRVIYELPEGKENAVGIIALPGRRLIFYTKTNQKFEFFTFDIDTTDLYTGLKKFFEIPRGGFGDYIDTTFRNDKILIYTTTFGALWSTKYNFYSLDLSGNLKKLSKEEFRSNGGIFTWDQQ